MKDFFEYLVGEVAAGKDAAPQDVEAFVAAARELLIRNPLNGVRFDQSGTILQLQDGTEVLLASGPAVPVSPGVSCNFTATPNRGSGEAVQRPATRF